MDFKVGRKYIDSDSVVEFILKIIKIDSSKQLVYFTARAIDGDHDGYDPIYCESLETFSRYTPLFKLVKNTRLARKMYPNAEVDDNNMLILEE